MPLIATLGCIGAAASPANASDRRSRMHISVKIPHQCLRPHLWPALPHNPLLKNPSILHLTPTTRSPKPLNRKKQLNIQLLFASAKMEGSIHLQQSERKIERAFLHLIYCVQPILFQTSFSTCDLCLACQFLHCFQEGL